MRFRAPIQSGRLLGVLLLTVGLAISCDFTFQLEETSSPKIYTQCISYDGMVSVRTRYAAPVKGGRGKLYKLSPEVKVTVGGTPVLMKNYSALEEGFFRGDAVLSEGDVVEMEANSGGLPTATGRTTVPSVPRFSVTWRKVLADTSYVTQVTLTLETPPGEDDYYGLQVLTSTKMVYLQDGDLKTDEAERYISPGHILSLTDMGGADLDDYVGVDFESGWLAAFGNCPMTLLTRKQFEGASYVFYLDSYDADNWAGLLDGIEFPDDFDWGDWGMPGGGPEVGGGDYGSVIIPITSETKYVVTVRHLSPELYFFSKALYQSIFDFLSNMGLTPANFTYSNVSGGLGVVGAMSSYSTNAFSIEEDGSTR